MSNTINAQIRSNQYQSSNANTESVSGAQNIGYLEGRSNTQIGSDQLLTTRTPTVNNNPKNYIAMRPICDKFRQILRLESLLQPTTKAYQELKVLIEQVKVENVNDKGLKDMTLLHYASQLQQSDIAKQLIEKGAYINSQDQYKKTPLHYASEAKFRASGGPLICCHLFDLLLQKNPDLNIQDDKGNTPLHLSSVKDIKVIDTLSAYRSEYRESREVLSNSLKIVKKLINAEANLNIKNNFGNTPLNKFTGYPTEDCRDIVNTLIAQPSCDVNTKNNEDDTPLHQVAGLGNNDAINKLLEKKADCNIQNKYGNTPLHYLVICKTIIAGKDKLKMVEKFIKAGAKLDIKNIFGNASLNKLIIEATMENQNDIAIEFIKKNPVYALNDKNKQGNTLLHKLMLLRNIEVITDILENYKININVENENGNTPLHVLCATSLEKRCYSFSKVNRIINKLIEYGANINAKNKQGNTPLILTIFMNQEDKSFMNDDYSSITMQLIKCGANINIKNKEGSTPLHEAIKLRDPSLSFMLLERGANLKIKNNLGNTPLNQVMDKISDTTYDIMETFIKNGAEVNTQNNEGNTLLHKAMKSNNRYLNNVLLRYGANPNIQNKKGNTPLHEAIKLRDLSLSFMLLEEGASLNTKNNLENTPLNQIMDNANIATAKMIVTFIINGAEVNTQNDKGNTPLHKAMQFKTPYLIDIFLTHGANPNIQNKNGYTPLHIVQELKTAERLIKAGASLNIKNNLENTPLNQIMDYTDSTTAEMIETFIINGAETNTQNDEGNTPLHKAMQFKKPYLLDVLLIHGANPNIQNNNGNIPLHTVPDLKTAQILIQAGADLRINNNLGNTPLNQIEKLEQEDKPKVNHATTYNLDKIDLKELGDFNLSNIVLHQIVNRLINNGNYITDVFNKMHEIFKNALPSKTIESFLSLMNARSKSSREFFSIESLQTIIRDLGKKIFFTKILEMHNIPLLVKALKANLHNENILYLCLFHAFINNDVIIYQEIDKSIKDKTIDFNDNEIKLFNKMYEIFVKMKSTDDKQMLTTAEIITKHFSEDYLKEIAINLGIEAFFNIILDMQNINLLHKVMETGLCNNNIIALGLFHAFIYGNHEIYDIFEKHIKNNISTFNNKELIALLQVPDYKNGVRILAEEAKQVVASERVEESEIDQLFKKYIEFICSIEKLDKTEKFTILLHSKILNTLENQQIICEYFSIDDLKKIADDLNEEIFFTKITEMQNIALLHKAMDADLCDNNTISSGLLHQINALSKAL